ncbi:hypothetical protein H5410_027160 [Solanum commersonii]|uniref:F-box/LRR-repeat protein 15/At3g58940/PEG3-like LRR domain-containing protein n=1 Tax=Solanum commersonii TaxID=4109 RepID=A0A9J5Z2M1_SOLCO|nr:hypothetical protein H5410_027160 [Solanum commersonii]
MIDHILLKHVGSLVKIFLDLSIIYCNARDLDCWLLCVTSKCVKQLTLKNHKHKRYTLSFCIFDCPTLTCLDVTSFIVKQPSPKVFFPNLLELTLKFIKFCPDKANIVLNTPLLSSLTLIACNGVHLLTISTPRIEFLTIDDKSYYEEARFITWSLLLYLCSNLTRLVLINSCIQVFNSLRERKIGEVTYYLEDPNCVDQQFEKLKCVELREFEGTIFELIFLRQILAYSPFTFKDYC